MKIVKAKRPKTYIPTASMADIAFLLIVFFMITTKYDVDKTHLMLPETFVREQVQKDSAIIVAVYDKALGDAQIKVTDGKEQSRTVGSIDDVLSFALQLTEQDPDKYFIIKADRDLKYEVVDKVFDSLRQANVRNIYFLSVQESKDVG
ncbi:ExbD/TolR family protein [Acidobacteriota bacterium]